MYDRKTPPRLDPIGTPTTTTTEPSTDESALDNSHWLAMIYGQAPGMLELERPELALPESEGEHLAPFGGNWLLEQVAGGLGMAKGGDRAWSDDLLRDSLVPDEESTLGSAGPQDERSPGDGSIERDGGILPVRVPLFGDRRLGDGTPELPKASLDATEANGLGSPGIIAPVPLEDRAPGLASRSAGSDRTTAASNEPGKAPAADRGSLTPGAAPLDARKDGRSSVVLALDPEASADVEKSSLDLVGTDLSLNRVSEKGDAATVEGREASTDKFSFTDLQYTRTESHTKSEPDVHLTGDPLQDDATSSTKSSTLSAGLQGVNYGRKSSTTTLDRVDYRGEPATVGSTTNYSEVSGGYGKSGLHISGSSGEKVTKDDGTTTENGAKVSASADLYNGKGALGIGATGDARGVTGGFLGYDAKKGFSGGVNLTGSGDRSGTLSYGDGKVSASYAVKDGLSLAGSADLVGPEKSVSATVGYGEIAASGSYACTKDSEEASVSGELLGGVAGGGFFRNAVTGRQAETYGAWLYGGQGTAVNESSVENSVTSGENAKALVGAYQGTSHQGDTFSKLTKAGVKGGDLGRDNLDPNELAVGEGLRYVEEDATATELRLGTPEALKNIPLLSLGAEASVSDQEQSTRETGVMKTDHGYEIHQGTSSGEQHEESYTADAKMNFGPMPGVNELFAPTLATSSGTDRSSEVTSEGIDYEVGSLDKGELEALVEVGLTPGARELLGGSPFGDVRATFDRDLEEALALKKRLRESTQGSLLSLSWFSSMGSVERTQAREKIDRVEQIVAWVNREVRDRSQIGDGPGKLLVTRKESATSSVEHHEESSGGSLAGEQKVYEHKEKVNAQAEYLNTTTNSVQEERTVGRMEQDADGLRQGTTGVATTDATRALLAFEDRRAATDERVGGADVLGGERTIEGDVIATRVVLDREDLDRIVDEYNFGERADAFWYRLALRADSALNDLKILGLDVAAARAAITAIRSATDFAELDRDTQQVFLKALRGAASEDEVNWFELLPAIEILDDAKSQVEWRAEILAAGEHQDLGTEYREFANEVGGGLLEDTSVTAQGSAGALDLAQRDARGLAQMLSDVKGTPSVLLPLEALWLQGGTEAVARGLAQAGVLGADLAKLFPKESDQMQKLLRVTDGTQVGADLFEAIGGTPLAKVDSGVASDQVDPNELAVTDPDARALVRDLQLAGSRDAVLELLETANARDGIDDLCMRANVTHVQLWGWFERLGALRARAVHSLVGSGVGYRVVEKFLGNQAATLARHYASGSRALALQALEESKLAGPDGPVRTVDQAGFEATALLSWLRQDPALAARVNAVFAGTRVDLQDEAAWRETRQALFSQWTPSPG